jgi:hypothetical protein
VGLEGALLNLSAKWCSAFKFQLCLFHNGILVLGRNMNLLSGMITYWQLVHFLLFFFGCQKRNKKGHRQPHPQPSAGRPALSALSLQRRRGRRSADRFMCKVLPSLPAGQLFCRQTVFFILFCLPKKETKKGTGK